MVLNVLYVATTVTGQLGKMAILFGRGVENKIK